MSNSNQITVSVKIENSFEPKLRKNFSTQEEALVYGRKIKSWGPEFQVIITQRQVL